jgi:DNA-binding FrmR family transcriptional regulator
MVDHLLREQLEGRLGDIQGQLEGLQGLQDMASGTELLDIQNQLDGLLSEQAALQEQLGGLLEGDLAGMIEQAAGGGLGEILTTLKDSVGEIFSRFLSR